MTDFYAWLGGGTAAGGRAVVAMFLGLIGLIAIGRACAAGLTAQHHRKIR